MRSAGLDLDAGYPAIMPRPPLKMPFSEPVYDPLLETLLVTQDVFSTHPDLTEEITRARAVYDPYSHYPDDLYQTLRRGFQFDVSLDNPRITAQLRWYASHQSYINRVSDRAGRYMYFIVEELQARDMPLDLALLPIVESAFDPFAYSHGSAAGMWQFIPSTGRMYGLKQDWWYDGRRDVVDSTRAALEYLDRLNQMFDGDWLLALAAYNSGPGTVLRAVRRNESAGRPTDFWHLDLPRETEAYVPKMFALAKLIHSPEAYGIELPLVSTQPYFEVVEVGGQIDLAQAAQLADMDLSDLYLLNPGYNQWATNPDGPHRLLVYADKAQGFRDQLVDLPPESRMTWQRYTIKPGDSLLSIAGRFNVTVDMLQDANDLSGSMIRAGDALMIPIASARSSDYALSAGQRLARTQNALAGSNRTRVNYVVRGGDTFWDISREYGVSVGNLARWNNMAPRDVLRPGQTLAIWLDANNPSVARTNREVVRKVGYVVRSGDSLSRIANKFNVRVNDIERWNSIDQPYIQPGQRLTLYVDVTRIN
ncbi:lytic transglycosylase [Saccharospirillum mangrovi]|uniref:lytic transglycosylase n=1 Tax=Saccharospirillum mangrovi TaxID=2161747 RepID=UPI001E43E037|nr:LysM peptidoglycan-binding domain-containing protein [Saccharospirillum mangrovi]